MGEALACGIMCRAHELGTSVACTVPDGSAAYWSDSETSFGFHRCSALWRRGLGHLVGVIPYVLLPSGDYPLSYFSFLSVFLVAQLVQIVSHVPGGIGVFEGTILLLLRSDLPSSTILVSLLVYRVIYTLLPFSVAAPAFLIFEAKHHIARRRGESSELRKIMSPSLEERSSLQPKDDSDREEDQQSRDLNR